MRMQALQGHDSLLLTSRTSQPPFGSLSVSLGKYRLQSDPFNRGSLTDGRGYDADKDLAYNIIILYCCVQD